MFLLTDAVVQPSSFSPLPISRRDPRSILSPSFGFGITASLAALFPHRPLCPGLFCEPLPSKVSEFPGMPSLNFLHSLFHYLIQLLVNVICTWMTQNFIFSLHISTELDFTQPPIGCLISVSNSFWPKQKHQFLRLLSSTLLISAI